ncbi:MAG: arsenate reductase (glutaredoxin) [Ectothiorhodospiraceae bacterium]|nr:arsenate reductase (glutaredoxin) [Ectothiorhodospiraceae bacterium]
MSVRIYHNPRCSKSRQTLALLRERGIEPDVVEYLKTPPGPDELRELLRMLDSNPMELVRRKETEFREAGLDQGAPDQERIIEAITRFPKLMERPVVVHAGRAAIGRPPERVLDIL